MKELSKTFTSPLIVTGLWKKISFSTLIDLSLIIFRMELKSSELIVMLFMSDIFWKYKCFASIHDIVFVPLIFLFSSNLYAFSIISSTGTLFIDFVRFNLLMKVSPRTRTLPTRCLNST
uniref:Uncharacterized protein n=1 Tax=Cacopsylla melanoneura TaxID=428564 RepID=A0A8D8LI70_9HEMI